MLDALRQQDVSGFSKAARRSRFYRPLGRCAMDYALRGVTTLEEVARVAATSEAEFLPEDEFPSPDEFPRGGA